VNLNAPVGFYGKLPIVGDFVSRRLPDEFISRWDAWLQSAIVSSQEQLGGDWLPCYLISPIWRFLLSPGVCGNQAVAGIVMPSVDKVGRYFPLTVAVVFEQSPSLPFLLSTGNTWFEQLEDVALMGLEGNMDINAFDQQVQNIPLPSLLPSVLTEPVYSFGADVFYVPLENATQTSTAFTGLTADLLATFMPGYSLWLNAGSEYVQPALLACQGLPPVGSFSGFLRDSMTNKATAINSLMSIMSSTSQPKPIAGLSRQVTKTEPLSLSSILDSNIPLSTEPGWHSWAVTDIGNCRKHNEDSLLSRPEAGLWVVADGMGGHKAGDVASQLIVNTLKDLIPTTPLEDYIREVSFCLQRVNIELRQLAAKKYNHQIVGSTVVALVCDTERCGFLWAGDSRLYRLRNNQLQQLTKDHCLADEDTSSDWSVKSSNIITRAVGADDRLDLDSEITEVLKGDVFLLCSDGLDKEISFKEIEQIIQDSEPQNLVNTLMKEVLSRGARDNVTLIVVTAI
jgi:type VI secretion system protein ImpM